jgi:hypothetical protein
MTGGNEGGRPLTQARSTRPSEPGTQSGNDWNRDQLGENLERQEEMERRPDGPDTSPLQDDEDGVGTTTKGPGNEGTTRY